MRHVSADNWKSIDERASEKKPADAYVENDKISLSLLIR